MGILCHLYQKQLIPLASGELQEPVATRLTKHLASCASCQREWESQQRLTQALFLAAPAPLLPAPQLWERLEAEIYQESRPAPTPSRARFASLGGLALAGAALAAVYIARPTTPAPQPNTPQVAQGQKVAQEQTPKPDARSLHKPSAVELARKTDIKVAQNTPSQDPFASREPDAPPVVSAERVIQHLRTSSRRPLRRPPVADTELLSHTRIHAVNQLELGTARLQTAELNREVREAELIDPSPAQRATCAPTEALASARGEASMGIFQ